MELDEQNIVQIDKNDLVNDLLDQNSQLRLEIAALRASIKTEAKELQLLRQMQQSRDIPPELWEKISHLDIR